MKPVTGSKRLENQTENMDLFEINKIIQQFMKALTNSQICVIYIHQMNLYEIS